MGLATRIPAGSHQTDGVGARGAWVISAKREVASVAPRKRAANDIEAARQTDVTLVTNAAWTDAQPTLSVLTPFLRDDPTRLMKAIEAQAAVLPGRVEIVALDDGTGDEVLAREVADQVKALGIPAAFVRLSANEGRAAARNRLAQFARGRHLLFLDADTIPDRADFLLAYAEMIEAGDPPLVIGGFSLIQASQEPRYDLHRAMAIMLDCMPAPVRQVTPWRFVYGANILVRRDVMADTPFNPDYRAWGWEDQEWGMRVAERWPIVHIDNTVSHMGLDPVSTLLDKYAASGANFQKILADHPDLVKDYPAYKAAKLLSNLPFKPLFRSLARKVALSEHAPMLARTFALRLFRVLNYLASQ
ncbi:glycosyltransferase family 2 protein [Phenylobacterium montanum]|uniref:Glycosyltransferase family 2 protein n=1 Tax=Phenylobacterium montanum TaxID=2823693 RepID=A0A975FVW3_9CAUL|nr:glycosyltransferase family 2 protein [Caulobacter sp. S6]QUD86275.1 glycosyltransferase family 2 protein [Caulobacter sp. S6]